MRLCRFDDNRLGLVDDESVRDATAALERLPAMRWPLPLGDQLIANLDALRPAIEAAAAELAPQPLSDITLLAPVANPSKIIGAPVNYAAHLDEARADAGIHHGAEVKSIDTMGVFLKATSSLIGPGEPVKLRFTDRRNDHEVELAVVIGRQGSNIAPDDALSYVAGYAIGLDMTVRGTEERSLRKSIDSYSVVGPWLVTADEIPDPGHLDLSIEVNGVVKQQSNTDRLIFDVPRLIAYASTFYTLYPGDIIMSGTPEGVNSVHPGDVMVARVEGVGEMTVRVA